MKLQIKKIIAREFLILLLSASIALVSYLVIYPYNYFKQREVDKLSQQISLNKSISDSLSKPLKTKTEKQLWFSDKYYKEYHLDDPYKTSKYYDEYGIPIMEHNSNLRVFERLKYLSQNDSIFLLWKDKKDFEEFGGRFGFQTPKDFKVFIDDNIITQDNITKSNQSDTVDNKIKADLLERDNIKTKVVPSNTQMTLTYSIFLFAIIALFGLRYIFYGIKWSLRALKQK